MMEKLIDANDITLIQLLNDIPHVDKEGWQILFINGAGHISIENAKNYMELEKNVTQNNVGVQIKWDDLIKIARNLEINDLLIVKPLSDNIRISKDLAWEQLCLECKYIIEYFDSSYWKIFSPGVDFP